MGRKLVLTGTTLTDPAAPKLATVDRIESPGSILLLDPTHPGTAWSTGVPADAATLPNLLATTALNVTGTATSVAVLKGAGYGSGKGFAERTTKGGLHVVVSPTTADGTIRYELKLDAATAEFLRATTHDIYMSVWGRQTRAATGSAAGRGMRGGIFSLSSSASNYLLTLRDTSGGHLTAPSTSVAPTFQSTHKQGWVGTVPAAGNLFAEVTLVEAYGWNYLASQIQALGGWVFYRAYIEDLTVSGRTYADVDALDTVLYTKEVLTAGGRYYGDTFTNPATIV